MMPMVIRGSRGAVICIATTVAFVPAIAAAQSLYDIDDLMTVTSVREFVWAPDGQSIYYVSDAGSTGTWEVFRVGVSGGEPVQISGDLGAELSTSPIANRAEPKSDLRVSRDGRTLYFTSSRYFQNIDNIYALPATGGQARQLTWNDAIIETDPQVSPDGNTLAYFTRTGRGTKIYLKDLRRSSSWPTLLVPDDGTERFPAWSPDGRFILFTRSGELYIISAEGGDARRLVDSRFGNVGSPAWSPDGTRVAVTSSGSGFTQIGVVDVRTGEVTPITNAPREHTSPSWSPDGRMLTFLVSDGLGMSRQVAVAPSDGSGEPRMLTSGRGVRTTPKYSPDGRTIAYIETTSNRTPDIWLIPASGGVPRQLTRSMGTVDPESLPVAQEVTYPAVDNLPIPALLFHPPGFDPGRRYPVVVALHGHPTQWNHTFSVFWHHMLQLGYVVIAPNPRGSVGFGAGFHDLHVGDYGGTEFEDVMRVVDYLETQPWADMDKLATWGGSGGGYMQFTIAAHAPDVFKAQIIRAPVSSWKWLAMERYVSPARFATPTRDPQRAREEFGGAYTDIPERYDERSPLKFVDNVVVPQLLLHGMRDSSVPPNESRRWAARMRELGKGDLLTYVEYPDEDHSLTRYRSTVRDRLERIRDFYGLHLSGRQ